MGIICLIDVLLVINTPMMMHKMLQRAKQTIKI